MKRNLSETEQRLIAVLKHDSRKSISEIASEMGISRVTAKKTLDYLVESGRIKSFTIRLDMDETDMALVHVADIDSVPQDLILENYELIDGTHLIVVYYEDLTKLKQVRVLDVKIAVRRDTNDNFGRLEHLHCDLCENEIHGTPIRVSINRKTYYACCPMCEKGLKKRIPQTATARGV